MRILTRYLVARFVGFFAAFLIVSILTIAVIEMMLNLGDMLRGDGGLQEIATYLLLRLPAYYLRDLVPIVAFAAAFFTVGSAARWLELLAAKAGGVSTHRIGVPLLATALVLAALAFLLNETVVLEAARRWNEGDAKSDPIRFREGSFWYQLEHSGGRTIYNIGNADRTQNTLRGVRILELDERGRVLRSIEAAQAEVDSEERLLFESPVERRFDSEDRTAAPIVTTHTGSVRLALREASGDALMNADLATLSVQQLVQVVAQQRSRGRMAAEARALLHARLAEPWTVVLFVLVAVPLGVHVERSGAQGMTTPALIGIAAVAIFFTLRTAADALAASNLLPPAATSWTLLAAMSAIGAWRYVDMPS